MNIINWKINNKSFFSSNEYLFNPDEICKTEVIFFEEVFHLELLTKLDSSNKNSRSSISFYRDDKKIEEKSSEICRGDILKIEFINCENLNFGGSLESVFAEIDNKKIGVRITIETFGKMLLAKCFWFVEE